MKALSIHFILFSLVAAFSPLASYAQAPANVILIQLDDVAFEDIGYYNSAGLVETPNIDQLAAESARFLNFYVSPVCATSRASVLTGRHHLKAGVFGTGAGSDYIHMDESTLADGYKSAGFSTGFIGKWHSGRTTAYHPWDRGFDEASAFSMHKYWNNEVTHNGVTTVDHGWVSTAMADRAIDYINDNQHNPFFLYYCPMTLHAGLNVMSDSTLAEGDFWHAPRHLYEHYMEKFDSLSLPGSFIKRSQLARMYGAMTQLDIDLGRFLDLLDSLNLDDNTAVILISDNGPPKGALTTDDSLWASVRCPSGMLGTKSRILENGIRSFCFVRRKGPDGYASMDHQQLVSAEDVFATVMDISGISFTPNFPFDGFSWKPILESGSWSHDDRALFFQRPSYGDKRYTTLFSVDSTGELDMNQPLLAHEPKLTAIRKGDLKLIDNNLYDIKTGNHVENVFGPNDKKGPLASQLEDWWNNEILGGPHSFGRAIFQIGYGDETVSTVNIWCTQNASEGVEISSFFCEGIVQEGDFVTARLKVVRPGFYTGLIRIDNGKPASGATFSLVNEQDTVQGNFDSPHQITFPAIEMHEGHGNITFRVDSVVDVSKLIFQRLRDLKLTYEGPLSSPTCSIPAGLTAEVTLNDGSVTAALCWEPVEESTSYLLCGRLLEDATASSSAFSCTTVVNNCTKLYVFSEGDQIEWYVAANCADGNQSDASTHQFLKIHPTNSTGYLSAVSGTLEKPASSASFDLDFEAHATLMTTFPNPAYEKLSVSFRLARGSAVLSLVDLAGQQVARVQVLSNFPPDSMTTTEIPVNHLPPGLYFIQLIEPGLPMTTQKVVLR